MAESKQSKRKQPPPTETPTKKQRAESDSHEPAAAAERPQTVAAAGARHLHKNAATYYASDDAIGPAEGAAAAGECGEPAVLQLLPVFTLRAGRARHAAFVCSSWAASGAVAACQTAASAEPGGLCIDHTCQSHGAQTTSTPALYRCAGR